MTNYLDFLPFVLQWEGGYVNDPQDSGDATNRGVTFATYLALAKTVLGITPNEAHFRKLSKNEAALIFKWFWDKATNKSQVNSQAISEVLTSWHWGSGAEGLAQFQKMLNAKFNQNLDTDGIIGFKTIAVINSLPEGNLFKEAVKWREQFFRNLVVKRPKDAKFLNGWLNRLNAFSQRHSDLLTASAVGFGFVAFLVGFFLVISKNN